MSSLYRGDNVVETFFDCMVKERDRIDCKTIREAQTNRYDS